MGLQGMFFSGAALARCVFGVVASQIGTIAVILEAIAAFAEAGLCIARSRRLSRCSYGANPTRFKVSSAR